MLAAGGTFSVFSLVLLLYHLYMPHHLGSFLRFANFNNPHNLPLASTTLSNENQVVQFVDKNSVILYGSIMLCAISTEGGLKKEMKFVEFVAKDDPYVLDVDLYLVRVLFPLFPYHVVRFIIGPLAANVSA